MTPQELKSSILQLAIQGKLVEQRPEEGTSEELYQQIQAEKRRLVREGRIKKEKPLPEIAEDEVPFEIPESWKWVKLGNVASVLGGKRIPAGRKLSTENTGYKYIRVSDMKNGSVLTDGLLYVPQDIYPSISRYVIHKEDIYITVAGTIGKVGKIPAEIDGANLTENADRLVFSIIDQDWLIKCLETPLVQSQIADVTTKVGQPKLAIKRIQELIFPLPPLTEQQRIIAKIEELFPYIERYEQAWNRLEVFNKRFPSDMQKSLLQMAIQGKLVEQRPEEGTAEELYQQIQAEKRRLVKEGKIKKEKPLPEIAEDEVPFDIPQDWMWIRLGEIALKLTDGSHNPPPNTGKGYPVISAKNIKNGKITFENVDRFTDEKGFDKENPRTHITKGDIILGIIGGSIGNVAVYEQNVKVIAQRSVAIMDLQIDTNFAVILIKSPLVQNRLLAAASGSAQGGVYLGTLGRLLIPLPPLAEQKRIVAKLEELLPLCERLNNGTQK